MMRSMILEQWLVRGRKMPRETKPLRRTLPVPNVVPRSHHHPARIKGINHMDLRIGESLFLTHHPQGELCERVREG
jgi:hypothetical protein